MESRETINLDQLKLEAQEYSVYITDTRGTSSGSGVLYYPGDVHMCLMIWLNRFKFIILPR